MGVHFCGLGFVGCRVDRRARVEGLMAKGRPLRRMSMGHMQGEAGHPECPAQVDTSLGIRLLQLGCSCCLQPELLHTAAARNMPPCQNTAGTRVWYRSYHPLAHAMHSPPPCCRPTCSSSRKCRRSSAAVTPSPSSGPSRAPLPVFAACGKGKGGSSMHEWGALALGNGLLDK